MGRPRSRRKPDWWLGHALLGGELEDGSATTSDSCDAVRALLQASAGSAEFPSTVSSYQRSAIARLFLNSLRVAGLPE